MKSYFISVQFIFVLSIIIIPSKTISASTDMKYIQICNETSPISLSTMNEVFINKKLPVKETNEFKCFLHCLFNLYGWMDEDGGFLISEIRTFLNEMEFIPNVLEFILFKCTASESVDRCQRAFQFIECFWNKVKEADTKEEESFVYNLENDMM